MVRYSYADHEEVASFIKSGQAGKDFVVVDVRDDDFEGGNIKGARNYPSSVFYERLDELVGETKDVPKVIFHCALSQQRGPKMARIYAEEAERRGKNVKLTDDKNSNEAETTASGQEPSSSDDTKSDKSEQEVIVLRGGFTQWQEKYKKDPELVENWKASIWASPY